MSATTASDVATEIPIVEVESERADILEPEWKRLPIGPDHILYPALVAVALFSMLIGGSGGHLADDMPEDETHPYFPDQFWPYPILTVILLAMLGLLAVFAQKSLQLDGSADPRAGIIPRPDWYFLFLFQFLKLGPELLMSLVIPTVVVIGLLLWPIIDSSVGPRVARRLGWRTWPVPGRNIITGTMWMVGLGIIGLLTLWALIGPQLCVPWFINGPICGG